MYIFRCLGHWTDLGEPELYHDWGYYHGYQTDDDKWYHNHADYSNIHQLLWTKSIWDGYNKYNLTMRPWILSRSGTAGVQVTTLFLRSTSFEYSFVCFVEDHTSPAEKTFRPFVANVCWCFFCRLCSSATVASCGLVISGPSSRLWPAPRACRSTSAWPVSCLAALLRL